MLKDKPGINISAHTSSSNNKVLQPLQGSPSKINVPPLTSSGSNLKQPTSIDNQFHQQNHFSETNAGQQPVVDPNLQELIKVLSAKYGPMKTPLEMGSPEYLKLVEILKQSSSINGRGSSVEESPGSLKEMGSYSKDRVTNNIQNVESASEQLWEGSLQLSSSVTLSAVAFFKSGEKLVDNNWPDFIEVKGKVRLEAFEKYVQDLPRSRNRGLMVVSLCWNEGSSNIGLNGMREVAKGYKKSSKVGFAHLLSGTDLYICPRSDPIITILAKYGFFKGMSVINDKPDSMIGCVVWRKNRPQNSPPGFSKKQCAEKKPSPEKAESGQRDEPLTLPLTLATAEVDRNCGSSSSSSDKKRPFEDDDLPEFDFGVACKKSTLPLKKTKLFDDDDMPEWRPPELHNQLPLPQVTTSNIQNLPLYPPLPPTPPPPRASFSYQPFRPPISSPPPVFIRPPPPPPLQPLPPPPLPLQRLPPPPPQRPPSSSSGRFNPNQVLWHQQPFPPSNGRRPQL